MSIDQSTEAWKDIEGFPGYQVSSHGRVRSGRGGGRGRQRIGHPWKVIRAYQLPSGYFNLSIHQDGRARKRYVHRLVLEAFVGPCPPGLECRHLDGDRTNNRVENLAWGTRQENADDRERHGTKRVGSQVHCAKLTEAMTATLRQDAADGLSVVSLSAKYGIRRENVSKILNGHQWTHVDGFNKSHESQFPDHPTTTEAGRLLGVTRETVQQLVKKGVLIAVPYRFGLLIEPKSLETEARRRTAKLVARKLG